MGMYTELIFGAELKIDTPELVIDSLKYMFGETETKPEGFPLPEGRCEWVFQGSSYYFGVTEPVKRMWLDDIDKQYHISTRSNIKNYKDEIETFLKWIEPFVDGGSGNRDMYAIVIYEDSPEPKIYYKHED